MELEVEFSRELKQRILTVIRKSYKGEGHLLDDGDAVLLFHWVRNQDSPLYDFVPEKYRMAGGKKNELYT